MSDGTALGGTRSLLSPPPPDIAVPRRVPRCDRQDGARRKRHEAKQRSLQHRRNHAAGRNTKEVQVSCVKAE